jgi:membrane protein DedA with SNARE-associated domain
MTAWCSLDLLWLQKRVMSTSRTENNKASKGMSIFEKYAKIHSPNSSSSFWLYVFGCDASVNEPEAAGRDTGDRGAGNQKQPMYELLQRYGLWAVFFGTMIEGDLTLLFAGVLVRAGVFSLEEAFLVGTAGGFVGDSLSYLIGARFRARTQSLRYYLRAQPRIERLMRKFGVLSLFIVKYVYGLRTTSAIFWGLAHFGYLKFAFLTLLSCAVWVGVLTGLGFSFAAGIERLIGDLHRIQIILLIVVVIIATVYIIGRLEKRVIEKDKLNQQENKDDTTSEKD